MHAPSRSSFARRIVPALLLLALGTRAHAVPLLPSGFSDQSIVGGLANPTSFALLPDGRVLVTYQRYGSIRLIVGSTLAPTPLTTVGSLNLDGNERGLLSIAVDPGWPVRPYVYVHHTQIGNVMRVLRYTATGTLTDSTSTVLTLGSAYEVLTGLADNATNHNGGALRFGPDGMLYLSLGDDASSCMAQDSTSLLGCILRMDVSALPSGAGGPPARSALVPADNPFVLSPNTDARLVFAYGLRNPFRFQVDPSSAVLYVSDVGQNTWEELDVLSAGNNAGWPFREGPAFYSPSGCTEPGGVGSGKFTGPIDSYDHNDGVVIISAGILRHAARPSYWPSAWEGNVFYADYFQGFMRMLHNNGSGWSRASAAGQPDPSFWATGMNYPVDFQWGHDGNLLWLSQFDGTGAGETGSLHRISTSTALAVGPGLMPTRLSLAASPNPARGAAELRFDLPQAGRVRLGIYDLAGRRVASLIDASMPAGGHRSTWHARDAGGRAVPAGLYLARLELDRAQTTARLLIVE